jgi:hypothetical protein
MIVQESLSPGLLDELTGKIDHTTLHELKTTICKTKAELAKLTRLVAGVRKRLPEDTYESLREELEEIKQDNRWLSTQRGQYVLAINAWAETFHAEFRAQPEFADVMIGGHSEKEVVFVTGVVPAQNTFARLLAYVQSKNPPFKLISDVHVGKWAGPKAEIA